ncbi:DUF5605 domain-containing protein [Paenibacillus sp. CC-CFT747]|nr:DUF5605 domain-containing protein [Paenibacillus sp. CC-CFT747]
MNSFTDRVERWGLFEWNLEGTESDNPSGEVRVRAEFRKGSRYFETEGFDDGKGCYVIRFMPDEEGVWSVRTVSGQASFHGLAGEFRCLPASDGNHGPVRAAGLHFTYADGTPFLPFGTSSLAWHVQEDRYVEQTLQTLAGAPFNKIRMSLLPPKEAVTGQEGTPFALRENGSADPGRINQAYFDRLEKALTALLLLGAQAELILFPANLGEWGLEAMTLEEKNRYVRYVVARLAAYRHVWWTLEEIDSRSYPAGQGDREVLLRTLRECDYAGHLLTVNGPVDGYDWGRPSITHISLRHEDVKVASEFTQNYGKPVVVDVCGWEGVGPSRWNSLTAEEMVYRLWEGLARGGYASHGEFLLQPGQLRWSVHGGTLLGEASARLAFLKGLLRDAPSGLTYSRERHDASTLERKGEYYLQYFGPHRFSSRTFAMPEGRYGAELIDTWNMTIEPLESAYEHRFQIMLPGELFHALRLRRTGEAQRKHRWKPGRR